MLHAANAASRGYKRILIIENSTYIILLGTSFSNDIGADKLWVSFGIGNKLLCHLMDKPETPYSDDIAASQVYQVSLPQTAHYWAPIIGLTQEEFLSQRDPSFNCIRCILRRTTIQGPLHVSHSDRVSHCIQLCLT